MASLAACSRLDSLPSAPALTPGPELPPAELAVPTELQASDVGDSYIELAWADTTGLRPATLVEGRLASAPEFTPLAVVDPGVLHCDIPVKPDSTYVLRIAARNDTGHSAWSDSIVVTARELGYWEVSGGIANDSDWGRSVFFRFGRANRFRPTGTLTISGPPDWNDGHTYSRAWGTYYIGLVGKGTATGSYRLTFDTGTRVFVATVPIDAELFLPLPSADIELLPDRRLHAAWTLDHVDSWALCWGPRGQAGCFAVGACTDTTLTALENDPIYWLSITGYADDLGGQPAHSSRFFDIEWDQ